ncbi:uracil phosphoribosyltransferase [bacterium]|nr:MAG: uracil phosphoribosyltransferase [bacterium]
MTAPKIDSSKVIHVKHPVVDRDLTILRDKHTNTETFRRVLERISIILAYHALKHLQTRTLEVETPITKTTGYEIDSHVVVVPILRAGLGLVDSIVRFIPDAKIGHLGMYRDEETKQPVDYYSNLPEGIESAYVLVVDPMLATGGSACDALNFLKKNGAKNITFMCLISAPEGIARVQNQHPDVRIITAAIDERLNNDAYIVPGLGDAGDRIFGTS